MLRPDIKRIFLATTLIVLPQQFKQIKTSGLICQNVSETHATFFKTEPTTASDPAFDPDINIKLRGWVPAKDTSLELVNYQSGPEGDDPLAPKLDTIFGNEMPKIISTKQINEWNFLFQQAGPPIEKYPVTMVDFATFPEKEIFVPTSGRTIGGELEALVLYLDEDSVTLKYTAEPDVVSGYTIHIFGICPDREIQRLYHQLKSKGENLLPAVEKKSIIGKANSNFISVVIRDNGEFLDPRSKKDWWKKSK